jgi:hypothetical protein
MKPLRGIVNTRTFAGKMPVGKPIRASVTFLESQCLDSVGRPSSGSSGIQYLTETETESVHLDSPSMVRFSAVLASVVAGTAGEAVVSAMVNDGPCGSAVRWRTKKHRHMTGEFLQLLLVYTEIYPTGKSVIDSSCMTLPLREETCVSPHCDSTHVVSALDAIGLPCVEAARRSQHLRSISASLLWSFQLFPFELT